MNTAVAENPFAAAPVAARPGPKDFPDMLKAWLPEIARALPRHLNADRMARIALTEFRKNQRLMRCDPRSIFAAVIQAAQLGLEPGLMGQAYLIPYGEECQLQIGYQGLLDLVRRSGLVRSIEAQVVYAADKFTYRAGLITTLEHEPNFDSDRGEMRLAYAVAQLKDGGSHVEVMTRRQIEAIRERSQNVQAARRAGKLTPWDTDTEEMWRKTVLRRISKFLPKSPELAMAVALDDAAQVGKQGLTLSDAIEGTWVRSAEEAPESPPEAPQSTQERPGPKGQAAVKRAVQARRQSAKPVPADEPEEELGGPLSPAEVDELVPKLPPLPANASQALDTLVKFARAASRDNPDALAMARSIAMQLTDEGEVKHAQAYIDDAAKRVMQ
jgi:recombination protein RecT